MKCDKFAYMGISPVSSGFFVVFCLSFLFSSLLCLFRIFSPATSISYYECRDSQAAEQCFSGMERQKVPGMIQCRCSKIASFAYDTKGHVIWSDLPGLYADSMFNQGTADAVTSHRSSILVSLLAISPTSQNSNEPLVLTSLYSTSSDKPLIHQFITLASPTSQNSDKTRVQRLSTLTSHWSNISVL